MTPRLFSPFRALAAFLVALVCTPILPAGPVTAQNLFSPVIFVNDQAVTRYEIEQRARMLTLFRAQGDTTRVAREQLIEERIKMEAARNMGLSLPEDLVREGMEEFAGRGNMTADELVAGLVQSGVSEETFREFVRAGVTWRELTRARFASRVTVTEAQVDRATRALSGSSPVRVLMSEIILPITSPADAEVKQELATRIATARNEAEFASFARRHSASASAGSGGRMAWSALSELPPGLRQVALGLAPGEISEPMPIEGGIALIMLRDIEEGEFSPPEYSAIEYAAYYIPGGRSEKARSRAEQVRNSVDTCDDLYGIAHGQPPEVLERGAKAPEDIPADIAAELVLLDPGEVSTKITRADGETLVFLMLCGRSPMLDGEVPSIENLTGFIRNQRIQSLADGFLEQLKAEARIVEP